MKIKIFGGLLVAALAVTSIAQAQTRTPIITERQHAQDRRIDRGIRHHELTRREAYQLRENERNISRYKRMAMADGRITRAERRHLRYLENRASRAIYRDRHNEL